MTILLHKIVCVYLHNWEPLCLLHKALQKTENMYELLVLLNCSTPSVLDNIQYVPLTGHIALLFIPNHKASLFHNRLLHYVSMDFFWFVVDRWIQFCLHTFDAVPSRYNFETLIFLYWCSVLHYVLTNFISFFCYCGACQCQINYTLPSMCGEVAAGPESFCKFILCVW